MTLAAISDAAMPGLSIVADESVFIRALATALAGAGVTDRLATMQIIRIRYRPGERMILNVQLGFSGDNRRLWPASIWLHAGGKARRRARDSAAATMASPIFEPLSEALVYLFPADPHVPEIGVFLAGPMAFADRLVGDVARPNAPPELVRYRPGLGATFRWPCVGRDAVYVKIQKGSDASGAVAALQHIGGVAAGRKFAVPRPTGIATEISAYAMGAVRGLTYFDVLAHAPLLEVETRTRELLGAMSEFHTSSIKPFSRKDRLTLLSGAREAARPVELLTPRSASLAREVLGQLEDNDVPLAVAPAHCDIKVEHIVFTESRTQLLDLDSVTFADPLFDLAMLHVRIAMLAEVNGCGPPSAKAACRLIEDTAERDYGPDGWRRFGWLRACAALQVAKHHSQNPVPEASTLVTAALRLGVQGLSGCGSIGERPGSCAFDGTIAVQTTRMEKASCG
jgi:Phosphotransferase enzyme family